MPSALSRRARRRLKSGTSTRSAAAGRRSRAASTSARYTRQMRGSRGQTSAKPITESSLESNRRSSPTLASRSPPIPKACSPGTRRRSSRRTSEACKSPDASPATTRSSPLVMETRGRDGTPAAPVSTVATTTGGGASAWRALWRLAPFARPHLGRLGLAACAMAVLALATGTYAFLVGPVLRFLLTGGTSALGRVSAWAPVLEAEERGRLLTWLPLLLVAIAAVKGVAYAAQFTWVGQFGQRTVAGIRRALLDALLRLSPVQLGQRMSGDLLSRFSADVTAVEAAAIYAVGAWIRDGLTVLVLAAVAVALDWRLALLALAVVPLG